MVASGANPAGIESPRSAAVLALAIEQRPVSHAGITDIDRARLAVGLSAGFAIEEAIGGNRIVAIANTAIRQAQVCGNDQVEAGNARATIGGAEATEARGGAGDAHARAGVGFVLALIPTRVGAKAIVIQRVCRSVAAGAHLLP